MVDHAGARWWALLPGEAEVGADLELPSPELRRRRHRLDRADHKLRLEANQAYGAWRAGGITDDELDRRRQGIVGRARQLVVERTALRSDWKAAYELARSNELGRQGRSA